MIERHYQLNKDSDEDEGSGDTRKDTELEEGTNTWSSESYPIPNASEELKLTVSEEHEQVKLVEDPPSYDE